MTPPRAPFKSVLVLFESVATTRGALQEVVEVADSETVIELLGIVNPRWMLNGFAATSGFVLQPEQLQQEELCQLSRSLADVADTVPSNLVLRVLTRVGRPGRVLAELARSRNYDLIVLPRRAGIPLLGGRRPRWSERRLGLDGTVVLRHHAETLQGPHAKAVKS
jgi:nucleotide-binding universal stress UspA family protein